MTPEEFRSFYPHLIAWITQMLRAHAAAAKPVASLGFMRLPRYFSEELLASTKVVVVERVPKPPLSAMGLSRFAEFEHGDYDGITYLDTFFVKRSAAAVERLTSMSSFMSCNGACSDRKFSLRLTPPAWKPSDIAAVPSR